MENQLTPMQTLKALVKMGIPFEQAYAQSWKDLRIRETQKTTITNGMTNNQAQAKANGAKGGRPKKVLALTDLASAVNNMLKKIVLAAVFYCLAAGAGSAREGAVGDTSDVYETRHYPVLELPQKLWRGLIYPLGEFVIYAEHSEMPKRMRNWFTNQERTFGLFPYVQLGGETGTGIGFNTFHTDLFGAEKEFGASYIFAAPERQTGQALYYVVRVRNGCGETLGTDSGGQERPGASCE